ncbi:hypothetical protein CXB51_016782 [Gossypium anomalum]|uniref:Reverse transcriptase zinc-binding domain-containing protein n=1 Tax=Gossypium anomalum TaxID=47600 RepID=A0A8J5ZI45_9ROSI|nr:hypothetical protein CXB51_016782 [Gossypium anomalum]
MECISSVSYSVIVNGFEGEKVQPARGLRQGYPLSPFMFLLCTQDLFCLMRLAMRERMLRGVKASRRDPQMTAFYFVKRRVEEPIKNTSELEKITVSSILGVRSSNDPQRYLGLPNMVGRKKRESFQILKDQIKQRIDHWSTRHLSQWGKEVFIKSILQAIPTYTMACFLLPKTLCVEIESIIAKFLWQKGHGRRGIHWCAWRNLCSLKGLGFQNIGQFNITMLAKQGWRLITYPNSLLARVLKAKYYPQSDFFNAPLGTSPSLTWKSVCAAKGLLQSGLGWRVGRGSEISVWEDQWIPGIDTIDGRHRNDSEVQLVADLIDDTNNLWKTDLVQRTFPVDIAQKVLQISLAEIPEADFQVWKGELSSEFPVRSAYKLLQRTSSDPNNLLLQADLKKFYKRLWNLQLPSKIMITIWRASWNYMPTLVNLRSKRVADTTDCPRCRSGEEDISHVLRHCPVAVEVSNVSPFLGK